MGKWAESPQTLVPQRFQPAHFWNKSGQKPTFLGKTRFLAQILALKKEHLKKCRKKWAEIDQIFQTVFPNLSKIGPKMAVFRDSEKLFFSRMNPFLPLFTSVPASPSVQVWPGSSSCPHTSHQIWVDYKDCPPDTILHSCSSELIQDGKRVRTVKVYQMS